MGEKTRTDVIVHWIKNNKVLSIVIVVSVVIIAVGTFAGALESIKSFLFPSEPPKPVIKVQFPDQEPKKCTFDNLPQKPFEHENSKKILIAVFEGGNQEAQEFGMNVSISIADRLEEYCRDTVNLPTVSLEIYRLNCFIQNHSEARQILDTLRADLLIWGNNFCVPGKEQAKFCPKATLTKRISPFQVTGKRIEIEERLSIADFDLPTLTAEQPYQLINFVLGLHLFFRKEFKEAAVYFHKAVDVIYKSETGIENVFYYIGRTYELLSNNRMALEYCELSLRLSKKFGNRQREAECLSTIGTVYYNLGKYDKALECYKEDLEISQEIGDRQGQGVSLSNIGAVYYAWRKYDHSFEYYKKGLKIREEVNDRRGQAVTLGNIGSVYYSRSEYDQAIEYYEKSLKISEEGGYRRQESLALNNIGMIYDAWAKYDQALEYYKKSLRISEEVGNRQGEAKTLNNIGEIYRAWGKYDQAAEHYRKSLKILEKIEDVFAEEVRENLMRIQEKIKK